MRTNPFCLDWNSQEIAVAGGMVVASVVRRIAVTVGRGLVAAVLWGSGIDRKLVVVVNRHIIVIGVDSLEEDSSVVIAAVLDRTSWQKLFNMQPSVPQVAQASPLSAQERADMALQHQS